MDGDCLPRVVQHGLNNAEWQLARSVDPLATELTAAVSEAACTGFITAEGRTEPPRIVYSHDAVILSFYVHPLTPAMLRTCPEPPPTLVSVSLAEPIGTRRVLDGGRCPPTPVGVMNPRLLRP
jgi:hypothetical protein